MGGRRGRRGRLTAALAPKGNRRGLCSAQRCASTRHNRPDPMEFDNRNLTRREAGILRRLAEAELPRQLAKLQTLTMADPPEPGQRERPYVLWHESVQVLRRAISKLRRFETT